MQPSKQAREEKFVRGNGNTQNLDRDKKKKPPMRHARQEFKM
jgi:hypothetical protein